MISNRLATANNPLLTDYDPSEPTTYIVDLDANNLYGYAMSSYLPTGDLQWEKERNVEFFMNVPEDSKTGYILEVDLKYPACLHNLHNDYPLAPESMEILPGMVSPAAKSIAEKLDHKITTTKKLVPNLYDKKNYVLHYRNFQFYLAHGMTCTKIHQVLSFKQSQWMLPYIEKNTNMRKSAKSSFEKDFYKLMNNSVFGKNL